MNGHDQPSADMMSLDAKFLFLRDISLNVNITNSKINTHLVGTNAGGEGELLAVPGDDGRSSSVSTESDILAG